MKILFITGSKSDPASRFRIWAFVPYLRKYGYHVDVFMPFPDYTWRIKKKNRYIYWIRVYLTKFSRFFSYLFYFRNLNKYDIVYINRTLLSHSKFLESIFFKLSSRIIFDFDDAIYYPNKDQRVGKYIRNASWVTPGNKILAEFAKKYNNNYTIFPTVIDSSIYYCKKKDQQRNKVHIGWSGSWDSMAHSIPILKDVLLELNLKCTFKFIIISNNAPEHHWLEKINWEFIEWKKETEVERLQEIDIGIMPLENKPFERAKCGLKLLQYGGIGIPSIGSAVGCNNEVIMHGKTGFLANNQEEWLEYLSKLINDSKLRETMGQAARKRIEENYSIDAVLPTLLDVFNNVIKS